MAGADGDLKRVTLREFLETSNLKISEELPWVHTTVADNIWDIAPSGKLIATQCNVFKSDKLCYCFVGRPAYKRQEIENPQEWELPLVFVMQFKTKPKIKRIFPFDSGAFIGRRLPSYILRFGIDGYDLSSDPRNVGRLISLLYGDQSEYLYRRPLGDRELTREHSLTPRHHSIKAVSQLAREHSTPEMDDRAAAIEIQLEEDIRLQREDLIGIVIPSEYRREKGLWSTIESLSQNVRTYDHIPLKLSGYYNTVYQIVNEMYRDAGILV